MAFMAASLIFLGVSKSGSPISRWTISFPCFSRAFAFASTSKAVSVPNVSILFAKMELTQITLTERKNKVEDRRYLTITALPFRNGCSNQFWRRLRFKFSKLKTSPKVALSKECLPKRAIARVVTVPNIWNGKTGLICRFIGSSKDLELLTIPKLLEMSKTFPFQGYPEALEGSSMGSNGPMKPCTKNMAGAT
jgi:hypothetical protein